MRRLFVPLALCCVAAWGAAAAQTPQLTAPAADEALPQVLAAEAGAAADASALLARGEMRMGFVNFRRIMASIPQLAGIREDLQGEFRIQQQALEMAQAELMELEQRLNRSSAADDVDSLTQQLIAKRREVARQQASFQDDYNVRRNEELAKLQNRVLEEIVGLAKEQQYDVILNDNGVIYVSQEADLTQLVIERLLARTQEAPKEQQE